jgi:hypothetical protein
MIPASKLVQLYIRLEKVKERLAVLADEEKSSELWEIIDEMSVAIDLSLEENNG